MARAVPNGCSLILNIGTTTEAIAHELLHHRGLRVITNNLNVAAILSRNPDCEVIVAGGVVRARDRGIVGEVTVDFIRQFKVDIALIGISGIEADGTLRDFDYREVKVAHAIIEHAREVWLAADHSKFNRPAMVELAPLGQIDRLFTDAPPPSRFRTLLADAGVQCAVAACSLASRSAEPQRHSNEDPHDLPLALDQGTSSSRSIVFDRGGRIVAKAQREFRQIYPAAGVGRARPHGNLGAQLATAREALAKARLKAADIAPSASPTSARRRWCGTGNGHAHPQRDRLAGPPRRPGVRAAARAGPRAVDPVAHRAA